MEITLEKIDLLRKRANVSYKEAKHALEENEGNVVEALAYLEEIEKINPKKNPTPQRFGRRPKESIKNQAVPGLLYPGTEPCFSM